MEETQAKSKAQIEIEHFKQFWIYYFASFGLMLASASISKYESPDFEFFANVASAFAMSLLFMPSILRLHNLQETRRRRLATFTAGLRNYSVENIEALYAQLGKSTEVEQAAPGDAPDTPLIPDTELRTRERNTLLAIIGVLSADAGLDLTKPAASAVVIKNKAESLRVNLGESTIERHLKRAREAMDSKQAL